MLHGFLLCELMGNIPTGREMVRQYGTVPKDCVETFKDLGSNTYQGAKSDDIFPEMTKEVVFNLRDNLRRVDKGCDIEDISSCCLDIRL